MRGGKDGGGKSGGQDNSNNNSNSNPAPNTNNNVNISSSSSTSTGGGGGGHTLLFVPEDEGTASTPDDPSHKRNASDNRLGSFSASGSTSGVSSGSSSSELSEGVGGGAIGGGPPQQTEKTNEGNEKSSRKQRKRRHRHHHNYNKQTSFTTDNQDVPKRLRHVSTAESDGSEDSSSTLEREAPDGGWGWVVVAVAFVVNLIADGVTFSFGVFLPVIQKEFGASTAATSFVGSLLTSMPLLSGPIASTLTDRYGCRKVTIVGGILAALGFILSYFVDSLLMLMLTFGVITGFGLSLCYVAAVVIVAYYFDKRRSFATGLSACGGGIGMFIYGPVSSVLIEWYDWRPTLVIIAGSFFILCFCGLLMKDLEWTKKSSRKREKALQNEHEFNLQAQSNILAQSENALNGLKSDRLCNSAMCIPTFVREQQQQRNNNNKVVSNPARRTLFGNLGDHRNSLTYRGAVVNLKRTYRLRHASSCPDIISVQTGEDDDCSADWKDMLSDMYDWLGKMFAWDNLSNTRFLMFVISNFLLYTWYDIPATFLTDTVTKLGYTEKEGAYLNSVIGIFTVVGTVSLGYIGDKKWSNSVIVYAICICICGIATAFMPCYFTNFETGDSYSSYYGLGALCGVFGTMIAANYSLTPVILLEVVSLDRFANAYGLLLLVQGIGNLVGPPIAGGMYDFSGSYNMSYWVAGGGIIISNLFIMSPIYRKYQDRRRKEKQFDLEKNKIVAINAATIIDSEKNGNPFTTI